MIRFRITIRWLSSRLFIYLGKYFFKRLEVHNKNTRGCNNFVVPQCRLSMGQRAFYFRGPREWNGLADNFKNTIKILIVLSGDFHTKYIDLDVF